MKLRVLKTLLLFTILAQQYFNDIFFPVNYNVSLFANKFVLLSKCFF